WVFSNTEDNRYCGRCRLGGECPRLADGDHHADLTTHQIGRQFRQAIKPAFCPTIFDAGVATLDIASLRQSLAQGGEAAAHRIAGRHGAEISDDGHPRLLPARHERPRGSAAEQRDELAALHSTTSSARASSVGGISNPMRLAVLRLITSSNFVDWMTGRSAGLAPLRMRPA